MPDCMRELRDRACARRCSRRPRRKPLLGVCVGMQMLFERSEEGATDGLGLIRGEVLRFQLEGRLQPDGSRYKVPQMGWNRVRQAQPHPLWEGIPDDSLLLLRAQLLRAPVGRAPQRRASPSTARRFTCAVARDNIFATQFHPEKSADHGLALYRNFLHWNP